MKASPQQFSHTSAGTLRTTTTVPSASAANAVVPGLTAPWSQIGQADRQVPLDQEDLELVATAAYMTGREVDFVGCGCGHRCARGIAILQL